jgi:hypothetical protein
MVKKDRDLAPSGTNVARYIKATYLEEVPDPIADLGSLYP